MIGWLLSVLYWVPTIVAVVDFFRRRPEWYWLLIIFFFGPLGAIVYLVVVVLPTWGVEEAVSITLGERRRKRELLAMVEGNPTPGHLAELGELFYKEGRFDQAIEMLKRAIEEGIDYDDARYYLGRSFERKGEFQKAVEQLVAVVRKNPKFKFGDAFLALGRCLEAAGQIKDAEAAFREVLKNHTYAEARWRLAMLLEKDSRLDQARELMEQIVADNRGQPRYIRRREAAFVSRAKSWLKAHTS